MADKAMVDSPATRPGVPGGEHGGEVLLWRFSRKLNSFFSTNATAAT
jgi:hypothetical protein